MGAAFLLVFLTAVELKAVYCITQALFENIIVVATIEAFLNFATEMSFITFVDFITIIA